MNEYLYLAIAIVVFPFIYIVLGRTARNDWADWDNGDRFYCVTISFFLAVAWIVAVPVGLLLLLLFKFVPRLLDRFTVTRNKRR